MHIHTYIYTHKYTFICMYWIYVCVYVTHICNSGLATHCWKASTQEASIGRKERQLLSDGQQSGVKYCNQNPTLRILLSHDSFIEAGD